MTNSMTHALRTIADQGTEVLFGKTFAELIVKGRTVRIKELNLPGSTTDLAYAIYQKGQITETIIETVDDRAVDLEDCLDAILNWR